MKNFITLKSLAAAIVILGVVLVFF